ncbi:MAG: RluA family pseudouridine synthase [Bacilli bacterium]|nr:RluA family pseudouridine synthase [Bacilli bacterium]
MKPWKSEPPYFGLRLDEALFKAGLFLSRSKATEAIKAGRVTLGGLPTKPALKIEEGMVFEIEEALTPSSLQGQEMELSILYEDEDLLIIDKPVGLLVHPGNGHPDGTLANALIARGIAVGDASRPGIVHRIDKDTSGCLAIAKTEMAMASLQAQLVDHSMHREYKALVQGIIAEDDAKIDAPIGRSKKEPTKQCVDLKGKEAVTYFHVEKRYPGAQVTLVSCRLLTGRTHQIRVHMDYIGHPVIGDPLYGKGNRKLYDQGQLLHAEKLILTHPRTKEKMEFIAPLPPHFVDVLAKLN